MSTFTPFNLHLKNLYDSYWNSISSAKLILLNIDALSLTPTTTLSAVNSAELPTANGYTTGGSPFLPHSSTYDAGQDRAEGRPAAISFTAVGGPITFNAWAVVATKNSTQELCFFYHYGADQTIAAGNTLEITAQINLGPDGADVTAPD